MKVLELKGYKSLRALNAFHTLMLGLKMLPAYMSETYEDFFARVSEMSEADQEKVIRQAALFVQLEEDEVEALISFGTDKLGVPYSSVNKKNLGPGDIIDVIVAVCVEISKIKIDLVSDSQKKKSVGSQST